MKMVSYFSDGHEFIFDISKSTYGTVLFSITNSVIVSDSRKELPLSCCYFAPDNTPWPGMTTNRKESPHLLNPSTFAPLESWLHAQGCFAPLRLVCPSSKYFMYSLQCTSAFYVCMHMCIQIEGKEASIMSIHVHVHVVLHTLWLSISL